MRITLDLDTNIITVPKNFFDYVSKQNDALRLAGVYDEEKKITAEKIITKAFNTAMSDTQRYLRTNTATGKTASKKDNKAVATAVEAVKN